MAKLTLNDVTNLQNEQTAVETINNNNAAIEAALDNTLSRDGTSPNQMESDLDMNSNRIYNLPKPASATEPVRLVDLNDLVPAVPEGSQESSVSFATIDLAEAAFIPANKTFFYVRGFYSEFDGGAAYWKRVPAEPQGLLGHTKIRTQDRFTNLGVEDPDNGGWWVPSFPDRHINLLQIGGKATTDGSFDNSPVLMAAIDFLRNHNPQITTGNRRVGGRIRIPAPAHEQARYFFDRHIDIYGSSMLEIYGDGCWNKAVYLTPLTTLVYTAQAPDARKDFFIRNGGAGAQNYGTAASNTFRQLDLRYNNPEFTGILLLNRSFGAKIEDISGSCDDRWGGPTIRTALALLGFLTTHSIVAKRIYADKMKHCVAFPYYTSGDMADYREGGWDQGADGVDLEEVYSFDILGEMVWQDPRNGPMRRFHFKRGMWNPVDPSLSQQAGQGPVGAMRIWCQDGHISGLRIQPTSFEFGMHPRPALDLAGNWTVDNVAGSYRGCLIRFSNGWLTLSRISGYFTRFLTVHGGHVVDLGGHELYPNLHGRYNSVPVKRGEIVWDPTHPTRIFRCARAGTTGSSTPSWNTGIDPPQLTVDGTVKWVCLPLAAYHWMVDDIDYPGWGDLEGEVPLGTTIWPGADGTEGFLYEVTTAPSKPAGASRGNKGSSEPTWPTTIGATVSDGELVWTCKSAQYGRFAGSVTGVVHPSRMQASGSFRINPPHGSGFYGGSAPSVTMPQWGWSHYSRLSSTATGWGVRLIYDDFEDQSTNRVYSEGLFYIEPLNTSEVQISSGDTLQLDVRHVGRLCTTSGNLSGSTFKLPDGKHGFGPFRFFDTSLTGSITVRRSDADVSAGNDTIVVPGSTSGGLKDRGTTYIRSTQDRIGDTLEIWPRPSANYVVGAAVGRWQDDDGDVITTGLPPGVFAGSWSGPLTITDTTAGALSVGRNGATNPVLRVDAGTSGAETGVSLIGAAAGSGVEIRASSSGTNETLNINPKGSGKVRLNAAASGEVEAFQKLTVKWTPGVSRDVVADPMNGSVAVKYGSGGWVGGFRALDSSNAVIGEYGFSGSGDTLQAFYIGQAYNNYLMELTATTSRITSNLRLGVGKDLLMDGSSSGTATIRPQANQGWPILQLPTTGGTLVASAAGALSVNSVTGEISTAAPLIQVFTSSGTLNKPSWARFVRLVGVAAGGGGGSGRRGAAGTVRCGGGGGQGGGYADVLFDASVLGTSESVTIGAPGLGGAAVTTDDTNGNNGSAAGNITVGSIFRIHGGSGGSGGTASAGTGGVAAGFGTVAGANGANASGSGGAGAQGGRSAAGGSGGGSGGGITSGNASSAGGSGSSQALLFGTPSAAAAGGSADSGAAGGNGPAVTTGVALGGGSGAGGGSSNVGAAGAGGSGGLYGAGGGGGGASLNGFASGAGGDGSAGILIVTWF